MFQQRRQATQGNIKLGNLSGLPTLEDIQFLLEQATKYRGRFAEVTWTVAKTGAAFQLTAKIVGGQPLPSWMLYGGAPDNGQLLWGHNSNDLTLIHNLVMLECEKAPDGSNSISASHMDSMIQKQASAGASAASTGATAGAPFPAVGGQSAPPAQAVVHASSANPAPAVADSAPGAQWLQNLNYGQAAAPVAEAPNAVPQEAPAAIGVMDPAIQNPGDLLDGSLANISVANLLHYLSNNRMTGRLAISSTHGAGEVFLNAGQIRHAATLETKGENALYDMATWNDGDFQFHAEEQTVQSTVATEAREIVEGCQRIVQYFRALIEAGLSPSSYLVRNQELSRADFDRAVMNGLRLDGYMQWRLYDQTSGERTFTEVLRGCPMVRAEWIPLVYNLMHTGIIGLSDKPVCARPGMYLEGEPINSNSITAFVNHITMPDGLLAQGAFLFLLEQEYHRHERTGSSFSLALFSIAQTNMLDGNMTPLDPPVWVEAMRRIVQAKRKLDVLGQFDAHNCAMLLPETDTAGAAVFANRIIHLMKKPPLPGVSEGQGLVYSFGIASVPGDARSLDTMIAAARVAKNKSRMMGAPIILYSDNNQ